MLLLLPLDKRIDWKNPPLITIFIILINCFIFFALQAGDDEIHQQAIKYYNDSGLAKIEIPIYAEYLIATKQYEKSSQFDSITESFSKNKDISMFLASYAANYIDIDYAYNQALQANKLPNLSTSEAPKLKRLRQTYLSKYHDSILYNYSLRPALPTVYGIFGHMFLHAGIGHLLGNMIFLFIVGFVVEAVLGGRLYLPAYLLAGLGSAGLDIWLQSSSFNFHLGASGAISGVMGMYAVLFGFRRIQFFYNILFWVDRIKAPAIIMLVAWLINELLQMIYVDSNVNYLAHVGGLLSGALIAFLISRTKKQVNTEYLDASIKQEQYQQYMTQASQYLGELNSIKAKSCFQKALSINPDSQEALENLLNIAQQQNNMDSYQKYAAKLIKYYLDHKLYEQMLKSYNDYLKKINDYPPLNDYDYFILINYLMNKKQFKHAEKLTILMFKQNNTYPQYPEILLRLAKQRLMVGDKKEAAVFIRLIIKFFPDCQEAETASQLA